MENVWYQHVGIFLAAILTLAILSFLYKDNVLYKTAEHIFVGVAAGYTICYGFWEVFIPKLYLPLFVEGEIAPPDGWYWLHPQFVWRWFLVVPLILGIFFFCRFFKKTAWLSRLSIAFLVGCYAGLNATGYFHTDLILQAKGTFYPLIPGTYASIGYPGSGEVVWASLTGPNVLKHGIMLIGVLASLTYFFFSTPHRGFVGVTARGGIYFLMVAFGASFGFTVMARISLFIGRVNFLYEDWIRHYWHLFFG